MKRAVVLLARLALVAMATVVLSSQALASHVRHVDISWVVPNPSSAPRTVDFVVTSTFRNTSSHTMFFGDGSNARVGNGAPNTTLVDSGQDASGSQYYTYRTTVTHTYSGVGPYTVYISSCCRISNLNNGADGNYRFQAIVDLANGNTSGPQTTSNALISLQVGGVRRYSFPISDPDGDNVSCRIATSAESSISPPSINGRSPRILTSGDSGYIPNSCILEWNLTGVSNSPILHALPIVMESRHAGVLSTSIIDIMVLTSNVAPPVCTGGGTYNISVGERLQTSVTATHGSGGSGNLRFDAVGLPSGATVNPSSGSSRSAPYTVNFDWTSSASDSGTTKLILMNFTNSNNASGSCSISVFTRPECGNNVVETGEACDDGNTNNNDSCTSECRFRPEGSNDSFTVNEDSTTAFNVQANDATAQQRLVNSVVFSQPSHGSVNANGDGTITYTPSANYNGSDSFRYRLADSVSFSDPITVSITVRPVNDAPTASGASYTVTEDTPRTVGLSAADVDGDALTYTIVDAPDHGILTGTGANPTYTPDPNYEGSDSFSFRVNDGALNSNVATVSITVNGVNDTPTADNQNASTNEDTPRSITLTGADLDGDPILFQIVGNPSNGVLSGSGANRTYTPNANFNGNDSFKIGRAHV